MDWPAFSLAQTINILIQTMGTIAGVLIGGWVAFRLSLQQVRHERALDRRLQWYEELIRSIDTHRSSLQKLATVEDLAQRHGSPLSLRAVDEARFEAAQSGRRVEEIVGTSELYASAGVVRYAMEITLSQLIVWSWISDPDESAEGRQERSDGLAKHIASLGTYSKNITGEVRKELGLEKLTMLPPSPFSDAHAT